MAPKTVRSTCSTSIGHLQRRGGFQGAQFSENIHRIGCPNRPEPWGFVLLLPKSCIYESLDPRTSLSIGRVTNQPALHLAERLLHIHRRVELLPLGNIGIEDLELRTVIEW